MAAESKTGDMFDAVTMLEERVFSDGIRSGLEMGTTSGFLEGQGLGLDRGFDLGQELGYIDGVVQALRAALADDELSDKLGKSGASPSPRLLSNLDKLEELVEAFPLENDKSVDMAMALQRIRAKFLVLKMITGLPLVAASPASAEAMQGGVSF